MNLLESLKRLRDDIKSWVTNNLNALNDKIDKNTVHVDSKLSSTSTNPVQNKVVTNAINNIPKFSGDYNDLTNAPNITEDDSGNMVIADESGNIIFKADADGIHTTAISLNGEAAATEKYVDEAIADIPTPDVSGQINTHNVSEEAHADIRQAIEDAKEELGESITSVSDKWEVADEAGNIIFRVDAEGTHTTNLTLDGEKAATLKDIEDAIGEIVIPEVPEVDYPDIEIKDDATIGAAEENFVNVYKNLTVDENNKHVLHEELVTIPKKEYVDEVADNLKEELSESIVAESDEWKVVDESGNIIFSVDASGAHTTELTLNGESAATESYVDDAIANIEFPTTDLTDYATKKYVDDAVKGIEIPEVNLDGYATETYVDDAVADLVNSAPEALDTLGELATALENHEDAYDALLETVGSKATHTDLENLKEELSESIVSETNEWKVVDHSGNIIFSVDSNGAHTTSMTLNGQSVEDMISDKVDKVDGKGLSTNDFTNAYKEKLDGLENITFEESDPTVPAWAKEATKPTYTAEEVGLGNVDNTSDADKPVSTATQTAIDELKTELSESIVSETNEWKVVDNSGNIILSVDADGVHTTAITLNGQLIDEILTLPENGSFAHGEGSAATGANSHAGGSESEAGGENAFAHGEKVYAYGKNQAVVGQYNKIDNDALFIVGGGDSEENRKNLFVVKKDGSITGLNTSNALTKTVSGEAIAITDASPIEHEMDVQVRGKNLINLNNPYVTSGGEMTIDGTAITLTKKTTGNPPSIIFELGAYKDFVGKTLTISFVLDAMGSSGGTNGNAAMAIHCGNTAKEAVESVNGISYSNGRVGETITKTFTVPVLDDKGRQLCIRHYMSNGKTEGDYITISNLQIEEGSTATAYAPYIEDISTVKVKKYGKNIVDIKNPVYKLNAIYEVDSEGVATLTRGNLATGVGGTYVSRAYWEFGNYDDFVGKTFVVSLDVTEKSVAKSDIVYIVADFNTKTEKNIKVTSFSTTGKCTLSFTVPENTGGWKSLGMRLYCESLGTGEATGEYIKFKDVQVEVGTTATAYEPYKEPIEYPVSADGVVEGVTPIYPTTTLMTDTAGAVMDCTYNRDINRVLDDTGFMYDHNPSGTGSFSMNRKVGSEIGEYSHAEGYSSAAIGKASHAGGEATQAKGVGAFAHGQRVTADADYQATFGTHNEVNANAAFIVGNGANSTSKNNAFEVQKDGNAFVKGDLYIGGTGSTQASAKQVATKDSLSAMEQRINNLEDITSSTGGVFFEDADVAYVKTIPENVAPYASLNKVGGMGIYKKKLANLIPSTYQTANGSGGDGYHTFSSDSEGVITIIDRTPVEEWTYEPWFSGEIPLNTIELPAGTYTAAIYADNPEGSPFGLNIYSGEDIRVGGARGYDYSEQPGNPVTFVLTETTSLDLSLKFECGGSLWVPTGDTEVCHFRVMLNEGEEALPWEPYSGAEVKYIEPAKTASVDIIGKNLFDYGTSRTIHTGEPGYTETNMMITDKGTAYIENLYISVEVGPGSEYGTIMSAWIDGVNSTITYPAGVYSVGDPVPHTNGEVYLVIHAKTINTQQNITIQGNNNVIAEPFTIRNASIDYAPAELTSGIYGIEVPLMLVKGTQTPAEPLPFKRSTIQIPSQIVSREDYGLGVYDTYNYELYNNYIDFERQKYIKRCLTQDLVSEVTGFGTHGTKINPGVMYSTICCSDPSITFEFYQPGPGAYELRAYKEGWDSSMVNEYIQNAREAGTPLKVFFGTNLTEEIDISAELAGIDNYIPVEAGGLIYFNNDRQEAVPSTIEYQSMMKKGEIEEL